MITGKNIDTLPFTGLEAFTPPVSGLSRLLGVHDHTTGEGQLRYFYKEFRYSLDGIQYTDWQELTEESVLGVEVSPHDLFVAHFRYTRSGTSSSGSLTFNGVALEGLFTPPCHGGHYSRSVFADYFDCTDRELLGWALNVMGKLYSRGIVPESIQRGDGSSDDTDYISFWKSMSLFFAMPVRLAREFSRFSDHPFLLSSFLRDRGLYLCGEEPLPVLKKLSGGFHGEMRKRGTALIAEEEEGEPLGELKRLLCKAPLDYFQMVRHEPRFTSFAPGHTGLFSRGTEGNPGLDIGWGKGQGFVNMDDWPIVQQDRAHIDGDELVFSVRKDDFPAIMAIYADDVDRYKILIDPKLNYAFSFKISIKGWPGWLNFYMGVKVYDRDGNRLEMLDLRNGKYKYNDEFNNEGYMEARVGNTYYRFSGVVFNDAAPTDPSSALGAGEGSHLKFPPGAKYIIPFVFFDVFHGGTFMMKDFTVRPASLPYSVVGLGGGGHTTFLMQNRNGTVSDVGVRSALRRELSPAGTGLGTVFLSDDGAKVV